MEPSLGKQVAQLRTSLKISQAEFAARVGVSTMTISRWEANKASPRGNQLIKLGNLAADADGCWRFWNQAGLTIPDVIRVLPIAGKRLKRAMPTLRIVNAGPKKLRDDITEESLVAIPFLGVVAAAGKEKGSSSSDLSKAPAQQIIAAPKLMCPNPAQTICMRVKGTSMEPTLFDGYIIVVDQAQTDRGKLNGKIIVVHHHEFGLVVSRFCQLSRSEALVSDNRNHEVTSFSSAWKIVGKVLWWIGEAE